ncbi:hypothetical protein ABPG73_004614 [Tetrahymena malaccensis]
MSQCEIQFTTQEKEEEFMDDTQENKKKQTVLLPDFQYKFIQKRQNSNIQLDNSNSFQQQIYQIDAEHDQKSNFKLDNSLNSFGAKQVNQKQQKSCLNLPKPLKMDKAKYKDIQ